MSEWPTAKGMELVKYEIIGDRYFFLTVELDMKQGLLGRLLRLCPLTMSTKFRGGGDIPWFYCSNGEKADTNIQAGLYSFARWIRWQGKDSDHKYVPGWPTIERSEVPPPPPRKPRRKPKGES